MQVPSSWSQTSSLNTITSLSSLTINSVGIVLSFLLSRASLKASMPSSIGRFVYMLFKSRDIGLASGEIISLSLIVIRALRKSEVSSIYEFRFFT